LRSATATDDSLTAWGPLTALVAALLLTPLVARLARLIGFVAVPRPDRLHEAPTPFLGGLAVLLAVTLGLAVAGRIEPPAGGRALSLANAPAVTLLVMVTLGAFLLGLVDDWRTLSPPAKLAGQVALAVLFLSAPVPGPFGPELNGVIGLLWIAGLMNACNMLDNMDGALAGAALPAAGGLALLGADAAIADFALVLGAAVGGFLYWNRPPARIFLGDAGSLFIGAALAVAGWMTASRETASHDSPVAWLVLPVLLAWPIFDGTFVTFTRIARGQRPWIGGRDHTTHRLATRLGCRTRAFLVVLGVSSVLAVAGVAAARSGSSVVASGVLAAVAVSFVMLGLWLGRVPVK
jgi:UDP-GlcNAc:undecaprenyl-phosphate GlcNAc-1-phosphate transferase